MQIITARNLLPNTCVCAGDSMSTQEELAIAEYSLVKIYVCVCAYIYIEREREKTNPFP